MTTLSPEEFRRRDAHRHRQIEYSITEWIPTEGDRIQLLKRCDEHKAWDAGTIVTIEPFIAYGHEWKRFIIQMDDGSIFTHSNMGERYVVAHEDYFADEGGVK